VNDLHLSTTYFSYVMLSQGSAGQDFCLVPRLSVLEASFNVSAIQLAIFVTYFYTIVCMFHGDGH
jgi:hypothetical protein